MTWRVIGNRRSIHQLRTSGSESRRSVSAVGAQSTTMTSHSPGPGVGHEIGEGEDLLEPGEQRQLLGLDGPHAGPVEQLGQVGAQVAPLLLQPLAGVELLARAGRRHRESAGRRAGGRGRRPASGPGRSRQHQRAEPRVGAAERGGRRRRGLADAALAGEEQDPRRRRPGRSPLGAALEVVDRVQDARLGPALQEAGHRHDEVDRQVVGDVGAALERRPTVRTGRRRRSPS